MSSTGDISADALLEEGEQRDWGTSPDDIEAYATRAGEVAGAAACAAVGAEPLAPVCGTVGGWVAGYIAETLTDWFTSTEEAERARRRRAEVREMANRFAQIGAWEQLNGEMLNERIAALRELHSDLWPGESWESNQPDVAPGQREVFPAIVLLASHGMPTQPREGDYLALGLPSLSQQWAELQDEMSDAALFERLQRQAVETSHAIERAYDRSVLELTARGAGDQAQSRAARPNIRVVSQPPRRSTFFGAGEVEPVGPGRVRVPRARQGWGSAALRLGGTLAATAAGVLLARGVRA